jgi:hypothetical protein
MKTLVKYHPLLSATRNAGTNAWTIPSASAYTMLPGVTGAGYFIAYHANYFDLAGMSMEEKTLFFDGMGVQTGILPSWSGLSQAGDKVTITDIMTTVPLSIDSSTALDLVYIPGFPGSRQDFEHVVYGCVTQYVTTQDVGSYGSPVESNKQMFGSGMPTASDRVYSYRFVEGATGDPGSPITGLITSQARHVLTASPKEETDHVYMMRLLRSYELQQSHDED